MKHGTIAMTFVLTMLLAGAMSAQQTLPLGTSDSRTNDHHVGGVGHAVFNNAFYFCWDNGTTRTMYRADGAALTAVRTFPAPSGNNLAAIGGSMYFAGDDGVNDAEPWISDGTAAGTYMLKDCHNGGRKTNGEASNPRGFTPFGSDVIFGVSYIERNGSYMDIFKMMTRQTWITDGTERGTVKIADVLASGVTDMGNGLALFSAYDDDSGTELWYTDGTRRRTKLLMDINPGEANGLGTPDVSAFPPEVVTLFDAQRYIYYDGYRYFQADDGTNGYELWTSDGTKNGTKMLKDIHPEGSSYPSFFTVLEGKIYFTADDGSRGFELWCHDPATAQTYRAADINAGSVGSVPLWLTPMNGKLYFSANDGADNRELFTYDPVTLAFQPVGEINPGGSSYPGYISMRNQPGGNMSEYATSMAVLNGELYFPAAANGSTFELWKTDGTTITKVTTAGIGTLTRPRLLTADATGSCLYFVAYDGGVNGVEWYVHIPAAVPKRSAEVRPASLRLLGNHPNPFNPETAISYELPERGEVLLRIYDILGNEVRAIRTGPQVAGRQQVRVDAAGLSSGVYYYSLHYNDDIACGSMTLLK